jgi:hypothetical protein
MTRLKCARCAYTVPRGNWHALAEHVSSQHPQSAARPQRALYHLERGLKERPVRFLTDAQRSRLRKGQGASQ